MLLKILTTRKNLKIASKIISQVGFKESNLEIVDSVEFLK